MATTISFNYTHADEKRSLEALSLVWIDPNVENDENRSVHEKLGTLYTNFKKFASVGDGIDAIENFPTSRRLVLVVSGSFGTEIVPQIHQLEQVSAIYVFCMRFEDHKTWAEQYHKVRTSIYHIYG